MEEYFKCKHCQLINEYLYESRCCGKIYCSNCTLILNKSKCNICNAQLHFQKNCWAQRMLKSIKLTCSYNCGKQFSFEEMKKHLLNCDKKVYNCKYDDCKFNGRKKELMQHVIIEHYLSLLVLMENYEAFQKNINHINSGEENKNIFDEIASSLSNSRSNNNDDIDDNQLVNSIQTTHLRNSNRNISIDFNANNNNNTNDSYISDYNDHYPIRHFNEYSFENSYD